MATLGDILNAKNTEEHNAKLRKNVQDEETFATILDLVADEIIHTITKNPRRNVYLKLYVAKLGSLPDDIECRASSDTIMGRVNANMAKENICVSSVAIKIYDFSSVSVSVDVKSTVKIDVVDGRVAGEHIAIGYEIKVDQVHVADVNVTDPETSDVHSRKCGCTIS